MELVSFYWSTFTATPVWSPLKMLSFTERINTPESFCFNSHQSKLHWGYNSEFAIYAYTYLTRISKNVYLKWIMTFMNTTLGLKSQNIISSIQVGTVHSSNVQCCILYIYVFVFKSLSVASSSKHNIEMGWE